MRKTVTTTDKIKHRGQSITEENGCYVKDNSGLGGDTGDDSGIGGGGRGGNNYNFFRCDNTVDDPNTGNDAFNEFLLLPPE